MAERILNVKFSLRNDTKQNWQTGNPVLLRGEIGVESDTTKFKFGDGVTAWNSLKYANNPVVISNVAPTANDSGYEIGTSWIDTVAGKAYLIYSNVANAAVWKRVITPEDLSGLGYGDMLKTEYAKNGATGVVDKAVLAEKVKDSTSGRTVDVKVDDNATGADTTTSNGIWTANKVKGALDDKEAKISLAPNKAVVSDGSGGLTVVNVSPTELGYLAGLTGGIQAQLDNIPKYNYLNGVSISVPDGSTQEQINAAAKSAITAQYPSPDKWDAVTVGITFTPSDVTKDAVYYFNSTEWIFQNYVTTGVQRANGTTAGIVENSDDITFNDGQATIANKFIKNTNVATTSAVGVVKGNVSTNGVTVAADGAMTVGSGVLLASDTYIFSGGNAAG